MTVRDMLLSPVSPPALRAALYQVAAGCRASSTSARPPTGSAARGVAVSLAHGDDGHARASEVMIFDEKTGLLLQTEERALDPAQYGLPASMKGAVVGWTVWVQSGVVDGVGVRPDGSSRRPLLPRARHLVSDPPGPIAPGGSDTRRFTACGSRPSAPAAPPRCTSRG